MSRLESILEHSRTAELIGKLERGEPVDIRLTAKLQILDLVRVNELHIVDSLAAERDADDAGLKRFS